MDFPYTVNPVLSSHSKRLEDLKVLKRSPDLLSNVKMVKVNLSLSLKHTLVLPYMGAVAILVK